MDAITGLIPTFRSVRAAFAAGSLWLVGIIIALQPRVRHAGKPLRHIWGAIAALGGVSSNVLPLVGVFAAAYLLGVVSDALFGASTRYLAVRTVQVQRWLASRLPRLTAGIWWRGQRKASTVSDFFETALGREYGNQPTVLGPADGDLATRRLAAQEAVRARVRRSRAMVLKHEPGLAGQLDELWSDAEYRLHLVPPVIAIGTAVGSYLAPGWTIVSICLSAAAALAMAAGANHDAEVANDRLAEWWRTYET
jgi:hypothetical protein